MTARMKNPLMVLPDAMKAALALSHSADNGSVPRATLNLVVLRASQINGCGVCVDMHSRELKHAGKKQTNSLFIRRLQRANPGGEPGISDVCWNHGVPELATCRPKGRQ